MKTLLLSLALCAIALSAETPAAPPPAPVKTAALDLSVEDQEKLSRVMILAQSQQLNLSAAKAAADQALASYNTVLAEMQTKYKAAGCQITVEKVWQCPAPSPVPPTTN